MAARALWSRAARSPEASATDDAAQATARPQELAPPESDRRCVRVASVKRVRSVPGLYEVNWRDGKRKRRAVVLIDDWCTADARVCQAVAAAYAEDSRPAVQLPIQAWQ